MNPSSRTVLRVLFVASAYVALLLLAWQARTQLVWIGIAFFLAVALSPAVKRVPTKGRVASVFLVFGIAVIVVLLLGAAFIPTLVSQSQSLIDNLGKYTETVQKVPWIATLFHRLNIPTDVAAQQERLLRSLSGAGLSLLGVAKGVFASLAATVTILGLTVFMLLEGPTWVALFLSTQPARRRQRIADLGGQMYKAVTGYVTGNVATSLLAGVVAGVAMLIVGVPFVVPLAILVALLDLVPLVGATLGAIIVILVALFDSWVAALIMLAFFLVYQQIENHVIQPLVYGRTVQMSPLLVLVSVLIGAALGGIVGALVAIPIAASIQIVIRDLLANEFSDLGSAGYELTGAEWLHSQPSPPSDAWWWRRRRERGDAENVATPSPSQGSERGGEPPHEDG